MFAQTTKEKMNIIVADELRNAQDKFGNYYNSKHEAYAVIKEEVEETKEIMDSFRGLIFAFWSNVRGVKINSLKHYDDEKHLMLMAEKATQLAMEATQIAACCKKAAASIKSGYIKG